MRNRAVALALAGAFFPTLLAIWSIRQTLPRFSLVAGGILAAGVLGVAGACARRPLLPVLGAALMLMD